MKKLYEVTKGTNEWQCRIEIEEDFIIAGMSKPGEPYTTKDAMKSMIEFWLGGEQRLYLNDGDILKTFLQQLAREVYLIQLKNNWVTDGAISEFKEREGWWPVDGTAGIKLTWSDDVEMIHAEFQVEEISA